MEHDGGSGGPLGGRWVEPCQLGLWLWTAAALVGGALMAVGFDARTPLWVVMGVPVLALGGLALYVVAVYLPERRLVGRLRETVKAYESSCTDLQEALDALRRGDLVAARACEERLGQPFRQAMALAIRSLEGLVREIQKDSVDVAAVASSVHGTVSALASGSSQEAAAVIEITATMEELARSAAQIASGASGQAERAVRAQEAGEEGARAVEEAVEGVESVRERMDGIASRTEALDRRSREIFGVLGLINDIARETHILGLNAAIEASTAGEHGQRFNVVAQEVQRLADRSRESVEAIRTLLGDFASSLQETVQAAEEGRVAAGRVLDKARAAAASIAELRTALEHTATAAREISFSTQEQRTASDQAVATLREIREVAQRTAASLQEFTGAADRLDRLGLSIQLATQSFRIESERSLKHLLLGWSEQLAGFSGHGEVVEGILRDLVEGNPFVEFAYLVDPGGSMVASVGNGTVEGSEALADNVGPGRVFADRPWFQAVMREGDSVVTPPYRSLATGQECFTVAVPVTGEGGRLEGVLGMDVNVAGWTRI